MSRNSDGSGKETRLLDVKEVASRLGISPRTIYSQLKKGTFPIKAKKWGRLWRIW